MSELQSQIKNETEAAHNSNEGLNISQSNGDEGDDEDDDESKPSGGKSGARERRKIEIRFIQEKSRRHITFSKRKAGIMKKAYELSVLTGTQVLLLVVSETGLVYTFTTPKLPPLVTKPEGKNLIQACLNAPEEAANEEESNQAEEQQQQQAQQQAQQQQQQQQVPEHHVAQKGAPVPTHPQGFPPQQGGGPYGLPPQYNMNPNDQNSYYMGYNNNQGYN